MAAFGVHGSLAGMSGLDVLQALASGKAPPPPFVTTLDVRLVEASEGLAAFEGTPGQRLLNPMGVVHGAYAMALVDSAAGCAAHSVLPPGVAYASLETKVNFTRAITPATGKVRCEGRVITKSRRIITAEAVVKDAAGNVLAHGTSTIIALEPAVAAA